jgi:hypothetical protein
MDAFHGCYQDTAHDYRHFASLYMIVRFLNLLAVSVFSIKFYASAAITIFTFTLALVAKFQPYKSKKNNTADIVMLLAVIIVYTSSSMHFIDYRLFPKWLTRTVMGTAALTIYCCLLFLILSKHNIFLKVAQCFKQSRFGKIKYGEISMHVEDQALLNHNEADYNSCDND